MTWFWFQSVNQTVHHGLNCIALLAQSNWPKARDNVWPRVQQKQGKTKGRRRQIPWNPSPRHHPPETKFPFAFPPQLSVPDTSASVRRQRWRSGQFVLREFGSAARVVVLFVLSVSPAKMCRGLILRTVCSEDYGLKILDYFDVSHRHRSGSIIETKIV